MSRWICVFICLLFPFSILSKTSNPICLASKDSNFPQGDGTSSSPYLICNESQFNRLSRENDLLSKHFELGRDLKFEGKSSKIGDFHHPFTGRFDGNNHTLSSFKLITNAEEIYVGLFGTVKDAVVTNLFIDGVEIGWVNYQVGTIAGRAENSHFINVHVKNIHVKAPIHSGGLIGLIISSWIFNCSAQGELENRENTYGSGGLIGVAVGSQIAHSSSSITIINHHENPSDVRRIGGLVGYLTYSDIKDSFAHGAIQYSGTKGRPEEIGGLVGWSFRSRITNAYAAVTLNINANWKGGAVGRRSESTYKYLFWDAELSKFYISHGGSPLDTSIMKTPGFWISLGFEDSIWKLDPNEYPRLKTTCGDSSLICHSIT